MKSVWNMTLNSPSAMIVVMLTL